LPFTFFLNFAAFFWIGGRAKRKLWTFFGVVYLAGQFLPALSKSAYWQFLAFLWFFMVPISVLHAFAVRKKYLIRRAHVVDNLDQYNRELRDRVLKPKPEPRPEPEPLISVNNTPEDCAGAARQYAAAHGATFAQDLGNIIGQVDRFQRKKNTVRNVLLEKFSDTEISFDKFYAAVDDLENVMVLNIRSLMARLEAFDEEEYEKLISQHTQPGSEPDETTKSRIEIYYDYINYAKNAVENNERMLLKLDQLILEINKLNTLSPEEVEKMDAMRQIGDLIGDAKWYK